MADVFRKTLGIDPESVVIVGSGASATVQIRSETLSNDQTAKLRNALFDAFQPKGTDGKPSKQAISDSAVSETWGDQITKKALIALVVFLVLVSLYITVRYERYMAISALTTMCFDLTVTAGVYSLVGFEVTPATVIGLLTILGFSLYDTVIVFDKVEENTHGFQHTTRRTFAEQANLAINQTFMRSINTSLISVLPVLALMVVAVWLLGVGTLKDLALVQLVGIIVGTYSSIFFATPLLVTLRERTELVRTHTRRVVNRRSPGPGERRRRRRRSDRSRRNRDDERRGARDRSTQAAPRPASRHRTSRRRARGRCGPPVPGVRPASETPAGGSRDGCLAAAECLPLDARGWLAARAAAGRCALTACSGSAAAQIDYVVDGTLVTYNTNTVAGAASAGAQAFARVLTGFGYHGPDGQVVADHDFGTVSVVGGSPLVLDYQIADNAVYSDGKPITCDDLVLAWAAQSGRFPGFDAASQAGYVDIATVECTPGQKKARVSFAQDRGVVDYGQLFTATSMMPSHVIADQLNIDVTTALLNNNAPAVEQIAQLWNTTWDLKPGLNSTSKRFPSSGPYKIESVLDGGAVVLVANDRWWGAKPITKRITVWPQAADIQDRVNNRSVDVVDVAAGSSGTLTTPDNYERTDSPSAGIEQLIFAPQGPLARPANAARSRCARRAT